MKCGIFKVNNIEDGGYYIDIFIDKILRFHKIPTTVIALHNSKRTIDYHKNILCNYTNPVITLIKMGKLILKNRITITYTYQFITLLYLLFIRLIYPIKIIAKVDGLTTKRGHKKYTFKLYDAIYIFIIKYADYVIYETEKAFNQFEKNNLRKNTSIIYTPATTFYNLNLDKALNEKKNPDTRLKCLYVGRYSEEKGFQLIKSLAQANQDCQFIMIGGFNNFYESIKNIIELGRLDIIEIIKWYAEADILIVPSIYDMFPSVIREFSYFGKPIIATDVGAINEFKKLGMEIEIVLPQFESLNNALLKIKTHYHKTPINSKIFFEVFDPNKIEIQKQYFNIFSIFF